MEFILETRRALLREFVLDDLAAFYRLGCDPRVVRHTADPGGGLRDLDHAREILLAHPIADYAKHGFGRWAVVDRSTGSVIGFCGLKVLDDLDAVDLGYRLLPEFWGRGLATETCQAVIEYGLGGLGLEEIIALALPENEASIRVMQKLGMQDAGTIDYGGVMAVKYVIRRDRAEA